MSRDSNTAHDERRSFIKKVGAGSVAISTGLAGCIGGDQSDDTTTTTESGGDTTTEDDTSESDGESGESYNLGVVWPYSGDLDVFGPRDERGMNLALQDINDAGVNGGTIEPSIEDSQTSQSEGVSAAQKLINQEGVPVLLGACSSGVSVAIAESVTIPNQVMHMIPNSTSPAITDLDDDQYVARTAVSDALQGKALAQLALDNDVQSAAIIMVNNDYGVGFANALQGAFENQGGTITNKVAYESGKSSYRPQLNEAVQGDPEALMFISYPNSFTTMVKQAYEMGLKDQVDYYAGESVVADDVEQNVPEQAINGMVGTNPSPPVESDRFQNFKSRFQDEYDKEPTVWASYTYDATNLIALALQKAGSWESQAVRDAIYDVSRPEGTEVVDFATAKEELDAGNAINYQGVSGSVNLNEDGDVPGTYQRWTVEEGSFNMKGFIEVEA